MTQYEHNCRACGYEWLEEHALGDVESNRENPCPECGSTDCYIACTTAGAIQFKGPGWSPDGYSKNKAYDKFKKQGLKVYDRKEDIQREMAGEAREVELKKLKREDRAAKRAFGPDGGVKQHEAEARIKKAGDDAAKSV